MKKQYAFYIDPQSYKNLAIYDYSLLTNLRSEQLEMVFFGSTSYDYLPLDDIRFIKIFSYNKKGNSLSKAISYVWSYMVIMYYIVRLRPQVIHFQWFKLPSFDKLVVAMLRRMTGIRLVHTAHNLLPHDTGDRYKAVYHKLYHTVHHIIVHSQNTRQQLCEMFGIDGSKVSVIPHGLLHIHNDEQLLAHNMKDYDAKYHPQGKMVFTALGEQTPYKGIDLLAKAWISCNELSEATDCQLIVVGHQNGVDLSELARCRNTIVDNRRIPDDEFLYLLRHTDVYLLPYRRISQSGALLTALAEHVPVLVTNVGGLCDPFDVAPVGWTIEANDVSALSRQLLYLQKHREEVTAIKQDASSWQRLRVYYDWQNIGRQTLQVYVKPLKTEHDR